MKCAIMQPTYLPWAGYFNLIRHVHKFVFLDDVQFERRSWQSRNRILLQGKEYLLTVPTLKTDRATPISKIATSVDIDWRRKHWQVLESSYKKSKHGTELLDLLEPDYVETSQVLLSDFNQTIIRHIASALEIKTKFIRATDLNCGGSRTEHLIKIIEALECEEYLSPRGSAEYLEKDDFRENSRIKIDIQSYNPMPYVQYQSECFFSHLSIVDVIANCGLEFTEAYIK